MGEQLYLSLFSLLLWEKEGRDVHNQMGERDELIPHAACVSHKQLRERRKSRKPWAFMSWKYMAIYFRDELPHKKGSPQWSLPDGKWSNPVPDGAQDDHLHPSEAKAVNTPNAFDMSNI